MKLGRCTAENFQSYESFSFDYSDAGLTLISGEAKAGKSTILDACCWTLYGVTSKDSNADDVRSWFAEGDTKGIQEVELPDGTVIEVTRIRGRHNDLYWTEHGDQHRGKDLKDTQKLLEERLGVSADLYINGSYLHQFSKADQFFLAKAKDRRDMLENIADLSLPILLCERASESRKTAKKELEESEGLRLKHEGQLEQLLKESESLKASCAQWIKTFNIKADKLRQQSENFIADKDKRIYQIVTRLEELDRLIRSPQEIDKQVNSLKLQLQQIQALKTQVSDIESKLQAVNHEISTVTKAYHKLADLKAECPTCLGPIDAAHQKSHLDALEVQLMGLVDQQTCYETRIAELNTGLDSEDKLADLYDKLLRDKADNQRLIDKAESERRMIDLIKAESNVWEAQVAALKSETNPFVERQITNLNEINLLKDTIADDMSIIARLTKLISGLTWIYNKSFELRGLILQQSVSQIEAQANEILDRYFDADLRVKFELQDSDKIEVKITNGGYDCPYKQLSGAERCLLKLSFSLSYMRAAEDASGVKFGALMLDEALNGFDANLKIKAFALLQSLEASYSSIFLIDHHSEFQQMFDNRFLVTKSGTYSTVTKV